MADATTPTSTTATTGTDVNLNLNFDDIKIPEASATTPDLKVDLSDVQKPEVTTIQTEELPAKEAESTNVTSPELVGTIEEVKAAEEIKPAIEPSAPINLSSSAPSGDDRLAQEDKIVEKKIEEKVEAAVASPETNEEATVSTVENTPVEAEKNLPTTSFKEDQKIIEELTSMANQNNPVEVQAEVEATPIVEAPKVELTKVEVPEPVANPTTAAPAVGMDLDSLLWTPTTPVEPVAIQVANQNPEPIASNLQSPATWNLQPETLIQPGSTFQTVLPPIATPVAAPVTPEIPSPMPTIVANTTPSYSTAPTTHKGKNMKTFLILLILGWAAAYVLKTMYPLEYENMKANVASLFGGDTRITETTGIENMLGATWTVAETGETMTWIVETTEEATTGTIPTWDLSTPGFDGFADLQDVLTGANGNPALTDQQLTQLKKFSDEAKTFVELGKKINDKVMLKYGTYVSKKADGLILSIENKEQIDNAKIDWYLAQFSGYIYQLTTLSYDGTDTATQPTMIPEETDASTSWENDTASGMIQDINRDNSGSTTPQDTQTPEMTGLQ